MVAKLSQTSVNLGPGKSLTIPVTTTSADFALPGALELAVNATSQKYPGVMQDATADLTIPTITGMTAQFSPSTQQVAAPGTGTFLLKVNNTGNQEDSYSATIVGTSGPVTASLLGLAGLPTQSIALFRLPALSTGAIALEANVSGAGHATVTVMVKSLSTGQESTVVATIGAQSLVADGPKIVLVQRYGIHMSPTTIVLTFDQALDPVRAENVHEYHITDDRGHTVPIKSAVYDSATNTVTLHPKYRINLHLRYKLTVDGASPKGLLGSSGLLLDGKNTGRPGSNYEGTISWRSLVLPPNWNPKWSHSEKSKTDGASTSKQTHAVILGHHGLFRRSSTLSKRKAAHETLEKAHTLKSTLRSQRPATSGSEFESGRRDHAARNSNG
jgi:hypothetical protein